MRKITCRILMPFVFLAITTLISSAQTQEFTLKQATKWYKKWSKDHKGLNIDKSLDVQEFARQYHAHPQWWDEGFAYLKRPDLASLELGRFQIDGDKMTTVVSVGPSREYSGAKWESHKAYADIHYLISGGERVAIAPIATGNVNKPFAPGSDTANYDADGKIYTYPPGGIFIIFPNQIHQPGIKAPGYDNYKKIVVKVKVD